MVADSVGVVEVGDVISADLVGAAEQSLCALFVEHLERHGVGDHCPGVVGNPSRASAHDVPRGSSGLGRIAMMLRCQAGVLPDGQRH